MVDFANSYTLPDVSCDELYYVNYIVAPGCQMIKTNVDGMTNQGIRSTSHEALNIVGLISPHETGS